jgi:hypothetical protein
MLNRFSKSSRQILLACSLPSFSLSFCLFGLFGAETASAKLVTFTFTGEVINVDDPMGTISPSIQVGSPLSSRLVFSSTTADVDSGDPTQGMYNNAIVSWNTRIGSADFTLGSFNSIFVQNEPLDDIYQVFGRLFAPFGDLVWNTNWSFRDSTGALFSSDALPLAPPDVLPLQTPTSVQFFDEEPAVLVDITLDFFGLIGDMDCDGDIDFDDIDDFVLGLTDAPGYEMIYGVPPAAKGDTDADADIDFDDIAGLVTLLAGGSSARTGVVLQAVPEPSTWTITLAAAICIAFLPVKSHDPRAATVRECPPR